MMMMIIICSSKCVNDHIHTQKPGNSLLSSKTFEALKFKCGVQIQSEFLEEMILDC